MEVLFTNKKVHKKPTKVKLNLRKPSDPEPKVEMRVGIQLDVTISNII